MDHDGRTVVESGGGETAEAGVRSGNSSGMSSLVAWNWKGSVILGQ
jgi:hypothetical protein